MMEMEVAVETNNRRSRTDFDGLRSESQVDISKDKDYQYKPPQMCKVALIGDSTVGKTTMCEMYCKSNFNYGQNYNMTFGVEIHGKSVKIPESTADERINLIVVDSSGKDVYAEFLPKYWDKLDGIALVIDLTSPASLENGLAWLDLVKNSMVVTNDGGEKEKGSFGVLIGNKSDLSEQRAISYESAKQFANNNHLEYFECSARKNAGLEEPFMYLTQQWMARGGRRDKHEESRRRKK